MFDLSTDNSSDATASNWFSEIEMPDLDIDSTIGNITQTVGSMVTTLAESTGLRVPSDPPDTIDTDAVMSLVRKRDAIIRQPKNASVERYADDSFALDGTLAHRRPDHRLDHGLHQGRARDETLDGAWLSAARSVPAPMFPVNPGAAMLAEVMAVETPRVDWNPRGAFGIRGGARLAGKKPIDRDDALVRIEAQDRVVPRAEYAPIYSKATTLPHSDVVW